jgi:hypothetical protein
MSPLSIALIVFACVLAGAGIGMFLRTMVPARHLDSESKDFVRLGMGLIITLTALVLGLVVASSKSAFDSQNNEVNQTAAELMMLDRVLAQYGPDAQEIRDQLRNLVARRVGEVWPAHGSGETRVEAPEAGLAAEGIERRIGQLSPRTDRERGLQNRALQIIADLTKTRFLLFGGAGTVVPTPFLVVLVFWLVVIFVNFGLFAPRHVTALTVLFLAGLSVSGALFLILELQHPFGGLIRISGEPMRHVLDRLAQ